MPTPAPAASRAAIRTVRRTSPSHLWTGEATGPWFTTVCGRTLSAPQHLPWDSTADEDRCRRCAAAFPDAGVPYHRPAPTPQPS